MAAFVPSFSAAPCLGSTASLAAVSRPALAAKPAVAPATIRMGYYDMDGSNLSGNLENPKIKSSAPANDRRCFKITYCLPSESRAYTFRELQNIYQTKLVPFSSWYSEQQRIMKNGGTIFKVELAVGKPNRNIGNV